MITLRMPAENGTLLLKAIDAALPELQPMADCEDHLHVSAETSPRSPSLSIRRADAAAVFAESFLAHGPESLKGGECQQIVVHIDAAVLRGHSAGCCELEDGPAVDAMLFRQRAAVAAAAV